MINGPTRGGPWSSSQVRIALQRTATQAGVPRRFGPHQLRHAHADEMAGEGVRLNVIQRQLGHANLGVTSIYLQGIEISEIRDLGERVLAVGQLRGHGRESGGEVESPIAYVAQYRNGKVIRLDDYFDPADALEAAGLEE